MLYPYLYSCLHYLNTTANSNKRDFHLCSASFVLSHLCSLKCQLNVWKLNIGSQIARRWKQFKWCSLFSKHLKAYTSFWSLYLVFRFYPANGHVTNIYLENVVYIVKCFKVGKSLLSQLKLKFSDWERYLRSFNS